MAAFTYKNMNSIFIGNIFIKSYWTFWTNIYKDALYRDHFIIDRAVNPCHDLSN
jgi:hypothetical protein